MTTALEIRNCLFEGLNSEAPQGLVEVVYLFGSFACNRQRAESDIDLAFLVAREKYSIDAFECTAPLHMIAVKMGMIPLRDDAAAKARAGLTSAEEVIRVTQDYAV